MLIKKEGVLRQGCKFPAIATILGGSPAIATFLDVVAKTLTNNLSRNLEHAYTNEEDASSCSTQ